MLLAPSAAARQAVGSRRSSVSRLLLAAAAGAFAAVPSAAGAAQVYVGDAAADGFNITAGGGTRADSANPLTYAFTGTGSTYTAAAATSIKLTEVNFFADEGPGNLTPFVARYNTAGLNQTGSNYTVLAIGDPIAVTGGVFDSVGNVRENRAFTVSGANPTIDLAAGDVLVAGLYQSTRIVVFSSTTGSNNDFIGNGNLLPASAGSTLTGNSGYSLNRTLRYNVGFDVVPEPATAGLLVPLAGLLAARRRRTSR